MVDFINIFLFVQKLYNNKQGVRYLYSGHT